MSQTSRALVLRKLYACFTDADLAGAALDLLDSYGVEAYQREPERVQLAILKLSDGDMDQLRHYVEVAKQDYRDVLAWAEYPEQMRTSASHYNSPAAVIRAIEDRDRQQYLHWLQADTHHQETDGYP